jgi:hypothetical protein
MPEWAEMGAGRNSNHHVNTAKSVRTKFRLVDLLVAMML